MRTGWRSTVSLATAAGIPVPAHATAFAYFDGYRSATLPQKLTHAQREPFGAHRGAEIQTKLTNPEGLTATGYPGLEIALKLVHGED